MDGNKVSQAAAEPIGNVAVLAGHLRGMSVNEGMKTLETRPRDAVSITMPAAAQETYTLEPIPEWVREVNKDAYAPRYIAIGPIHRGEHDNLLRRKALKDKYLDRLMELDKEPELAAYGFVPLPKEDCLEALKKNEKKTSRFYPQHVKETIGEDEWLDMLLLDGCFVVMHLLEFYFGIKTSTHTKWEWAVLKIDLILLENQLPFSVLECIMRCILPNESHEAHLLTRIMVVDYWVYRGRDAYDFIVVGRLLGNEKFTEVNHLVHLIHLAHYQMIYHGDKINEDSGGCCIVYGLIIFCIWKICNFPILAMKLLTLPCTILCKFVDPEEKKEKARKKKMSKQLEEEEGWSGDEGVEDESEDEDEKNIPSATEVHNLGIDFRKKYLLGPKSKYHVRINAFDNNTLDIPQLKVSSSEAPLLHNLIAWEHRARASGKNEYDDEEHFTKYAFLMYNLINKPDDIALLQRKGILLNKLGTDDEVVSYFKDLVLWNSRNPKSSKPKEKTTPSSKSLLEKVKKFFFPEEACPSSKSLLEKVKKFFFPEEEQRSKIDQVMEVLKHRVEQPEYRYWAEVKKYFNSPLQVLLVVTSSVLFVSTLVPAILSVHMTK